MPNLITIADMVEVCGLNDNVEARKVNDRIVEAQLRFERVVGASLYTLLKAAWDADQTLAGSGNERYRNLLAFGKGYGKDFLCWKAMELAYPRLHSEADRNGVYVKQDAASDFIGVDSRVLTMHINEAKDCAEDRLDRLVSYLINNSATFPEYSTTGTGEQRIDESNGGGFVLTPSTRTESYRG